MNAAVSPRPCVVVTASGSVCTRRGEWLIGSKKTWSWSHEKYCLQHAIAQARLAGRPNLWHGSTFEIRTVKDIPLRPRKPRAVPLPVDGETALVKAFNDARTPAEFRRCRLAWIRQYAALGRAESVLSAHIAASRRLGGLLS